MLTNQRLQVVVLSIIFAILAVIVVLMWWPYLTFVAMGAILAILFHPVYKYLLAKMGKESLAAWATIILVLLIVMIPLYLIGQLAYNELNVIYKEYQSGQLVWNQTEFVKGLPPQFQGWAGDFSSNFGQKLSDFASNAFAGTASLLSNVFNFFLSFFFVFFSFYYLLKDGQRVKDYLGGILPLDPAHGDLLIIKLERAVSGVIKGQFLVALIQGVTAVAGFLLFGVPQPLLWGAFTILAALVPTVGTSLSLIPAVIYLFVTGHIGAGVGMAIWGTLAVGTIDNFVGPKLVGRKMDLHPFLVLFSVLGGLQFFGLLGILLGPVLMAMFMALVEIYRVDLKGYMGK